MKSVFRCILCISKIWNLFFVAVWATSICYFSILEQQQFHFAQIDIFCNPWLNTFCGKSTPFERPKWFFCLWTLLRYHLKRLRQVLCWRMGPLLICCSSLAHISSVEKSWWSTQQLYTDTYDKHFVHLLQFLMVSTFTMRSSTFFLEYSKQIYISILQPDLVLVSKNLHHIPCWIKVPIFSSRNLCWW